MKKYVVAAVTAGLVAGAAAIAPGAQAVAPHGAATAGLASSISAASSARSAGSASADALTASADPAFKPKPIAWLKKCPASWEMDPSMSAQCGFLTVPLNYAHPGWTKIKLAVSRVKHTVSKAKYQGIMLVNPGGPGGSGVSLSDLGSVVPKKVGNDYDWIGFDPRGVGHSVPALTCNGKYFKYDRPAYVPSTSKLEKAWRARAKAYAKACDKSKAGKLLDHAKTVDTVKDMDSIRKALGRTQINYYGFSYGTYLGQVYSTLYPTRVRRMVLDGVVDPTRVWYAANLDQDTAFDRNIKIYFTWVAKYDSVYHLGKTEAAVEKLFYSTQAKLTKKPAGGKIGGDEWNDIFLQAGYYVFGWETVAEAFSGYIHKGDWKTLKVLYDESSPQGAGADNEYAMYLATQCTDVQWPTSWSKWQKDNQAIYAKAPFETWGNAWFNAPCINWGGKAGKPVKINGAKAPSTLLISETLDAATPYSGALEVRKLYPKSVLIEGVGGTTHAGSLFGVSCTDNTIAAYLSKGTLPARVAGNMSDKKCPPNPQPDPTAPSASQKAASAGSAARLALEAAGKQA